VLSVGNARPHKNLGLLLGALALIEPSRRPLLVLPGSGLDVVLARQVSDLGLDHDVRLPGWVADSDLERLFATSTAYICPSLFEGFGLPVLEAMQRGVPVACSDIPVLREVAGEAATFFDPRSPRSAATALEALVSDPVGAAELSRRGYERAAEFTWDRTAALTIASYERALATSPRRTRRRT